MEIVGIARYCYNPNCGDISRWGICPDDDTTNLLVRARRNPTCPYCLTTGKQVEFMPLWAPYPGPSRKCVREWPEGIYYRVK